MILFATIPLLLIAMYQDWKTRSFWAWIVGAVFAIGILNSCVQHGLSMAIQQWLWSLLFMSVFLLPLLIYVKLKLVRWSKVFNQGFGLGDLLFLLAITPIFAWQELPIVMTMASVTALILHRFILKQDKDRIPFVSYLGSVLIVMIMFKVISSLIEAQVPYVI